MPKKVTRKRGAPKDAPSAFDKVLYVRVSKELYDLLEDLRKVRSPRGVSISKADVVRTIIWEALEEEGLAEN